MSLLQISSKIFIICIIQDELDSKLNTLTDKDNKILKKVEGNSKTVQRLGFEFVSFQMIVEYIYTIIHSFAQDKLDSKLNALTNKVDGNTKQVGEIGSEFVSFMRQYLSLSTN